MTLLETEREIERQPTFHKHPPSLGGRVGVDASAVPDWGTQDAPKQAPRLLTAYAEGSRIAGQRALQRLAFFFALRADRTLVIHHRLHFGLEVPLHQRGQVLREPFTIDLLAAGQLEHPSERDPRWAWVSASSMAL